MQGKTRHYAQLMKITTSSSKILTMDARVIQGVRDRWRVIVRHCYYYLPAKLLRGDGGRGMRGQRGEGKQCWGIDMRWRQ